VAVIVIAAVVVVALASLWVYDRRHRATRVDQRRIDAERAEVADRQRMFGPRGGGGFGGSGL
jgi:hypothetical protein